MSQRSTLVVYTMCSRWGDVDRKLHHPLFFGNRLLVGITMGTEPVPKQKKGLLKIFLTGGGWVFLAVEIKLLGQETDEIGLEPPFAEAGEIFEFQSSLISF